MSGRRSNIHVWGMLIGSPVQCANCEQRAWSELAAPASLSLSPTSKFLRLLQTRWSMAAKKKKKKSRKRAIFSPPLQNMGRKRRRSHSDLEDERHANSELGKRRHSGESVKLACPFFRNLKFSSLPPISRTCHNGSSGMRHVKYASFQGKSACWRSDKL